jgi:hypothetical protein
MPKKTQEVTVPMSEELEGLIEEPLGYGDAKSARIRELIRKGLVADGVDPERIPEEDDQRSKEREPDGGQATLAD